MAEPAAALGASSDAVLAVRGLRKAFGALVVSDDVDLDVRAGECHALIGPNGAGKTTLLRLITRILRADSGRIVLNGADVSALRP